MDALLERVNDELASTLEAVGRGLVRITTRGRGFGAGVVCHPQGLIVTNAHVVGAGPVQVTLPSGESLPAKVKAVSRGHDLAVLIVEADGLPCVDLTQSADVRPGQLVFALGHPWGVRGAVTAGTVIGVGPRLPESSGQDRRLLAASLKLRPGHSGGPMVDVRGRLVGVNTMMAGPEVGLAVPVGVVREFLREALGSRPASA